MRSGNSFFFRSLQSGKQLDFAAGPYQSGQMAVINQAVTLSPEKVTELNLKLSEFRHDVNNHLALMIAAAELLRRKPEIAPKIAVSLSDPAKKITEAVRIFSCDVEQALLGSDGN